MAYASSVVVASGLTAVFTIPCPYLSTEHIHVKVDNIPVDDVDITVSGSTVTLNKGAPDTGAAVKVYRRTPSDDLIARFSDPSILQDDDLNNALLQLLYLSQEALDDSIVATQIADTVATAYAELVILIDQAQDLLTDTAQAAADAQAAAAAAEAAYAGLVGDVEDAVAAVLDATVETAIATRLTYKNIIRNSAMAVSQEQGGAIVTSTGFYAVDRWIGSHSLSGGAVSYQQVASGDTEGSRFCLEIKATTADVTIGAGDYLFTQYGAEGWEVAHLAWGTAQAAEATLRFRVKLPAGTYHVSVRNADGSRSLVMPFVISGGEANTYVTKTLTIPGCTDGTWQTTNGAGAYLTFVLMAGSTYEITSGSWGTSFGLSASGQFNFMGTLNNTFRLKDVALYVGDVTDPKYEVPSYEDELLNAKRYWQKSDTLLWSGEMVAGQQYFHPKLHEVEMRTTGSHTFAYVASNGFPATAPTLNGGTYVKQVIANLPAPIATGAGFYQYTVASNSRL